jgi:methionyl-tRNA formyltransferase
MTIMRILFFGITQLAVKALRQLIADNKKPVAVVVSSTNNNDIYNVRLICKDNNIPVYAFEDINCQEFLSIVKNELKPDLILTYTFSQKLSDELINSATWAINMHPALLPNYRGANPYFWTIANGETKTGITFHFLNNRFDEGDIITQAEIPIFDRDTCGIIMNKQEKLGSSMLEEIFDMLENNIIVRTPQPQGDFPKAPKVNLKETFIQWDWPVKKIINRIRALNPFNGALVQYRHQLVGIYEATSTSYVYDPDKDNGTIITLTPEGPMVKCSDGSLIIRICVVGKKYLLSGTDFIEHEKIKEGERFIQPW